jgi:hypothetical protein
MNSFAQLPAEQRALFFRELVMRRGVSPVIAEKDFWVCWTLGRLFASTDLAPALVFKGGTSLSKVFGAIERFSEDIDLSISPALLGWDESDLDEAPSSSQRGKRMKKLEGACIRAVEERFQPLLEAAVREILGAAPAGRWLRFQIDPISNSPVLLFAYPSSADGTSDYVEPAVKIEFGSLTDQRPRGRHRVSPMVAEIAPGEFDDFTAEVVALELESSFWEKATILHAEYYRPQGQRIRDRFARHYADFAALWRHPGAQTARQRLDLLERVVIHKSRFFGSSWANYDTARPGTLRLAPPAAREPELRADLQKMRAMFLTEPPDFAELLATLREAEETLNGR